MFKIQYAKFNLGYAGIIKANHLNAGNVLNQSKVVYSNDRTGTISEHVAKGSQLYTLVMCWYHSQNKNAADYIRGFHADKNGNGFRWHHGAGYDILGDLFDTIELIKHNHTANGVGDTDGYIYDWIKYETDPTANHDAKINNALSALANSRYALVVNHLKTPAVYDYLTEMDLIPDADNYMSLSTFMVDFASRYKNNVINYGAKEFREWCYFAKILYNDPNDRNGGVSKAMNNAEKILINPDGLHGPEIVKSDDLLNFINQTAAEIETLK